MVNRGAQLESEGCVDEYESRTHHAWHSEESILYSNGIEAVSIED